MSTPRPADNPPSARRAATRERLISAAVPVIARRGVLGCSVEEVCEAAGFTRGAFYSNFDNKDELCIAVLERQGRRYLDAARDAIARLDPQLPPADQIAAAAAAFITHAGGDPDLVLAMSELRLHAAREPAIRDAFRCVDDEVSPLFGQLIEDAVHSLGRQLRMPVHEALSLLHAVYDQTALDQLIRGEEPAAPVASQRLALVLEALLAPGDD